MQSIDDVIVAETPLPAGVDPAQVSFPQVEGIPLDLVGPIRWDHPCAAGTYVNDIARSVVRTKDGRKRRKVCIVGYAENSRHLAWYNDPDCEIWGVNQLYRFIPRADRFFQIHLDWNDKTKWAANTDVAKWMAEAPIPIYMIQHEPSIPNSIPYPVDWVKEQLNLKGDKDIPGSDLDYFTSTIAFMYALAIAEGFEEIGIYGIDLIIGREFFFEKACVEFYMGIAHAKGIHLHKPANSALLWQSHRYGYEMEPDYGFYNLSKLKARMAQITKQCAVLRDELHKADGAYNESVFMHERLSEPYRTQYGERVDALRKALDTKLNHYFLHDGALQEITRMYQILEVRSRGGQVE